MSTPSITIEHAIGAELPWVVVIAGEDNAAFTTEEEAEEHAQAIELLVALPDLNDLEKVAKASLATWDGTEDSFWWTKDEVETWWTEDEDVWTGDDEDAAFIAAANPRVVLGLLYKLKAAQTMLDIAREQGFA